MNADLEYLVMLNSFFSPSVPQILQNKVDLTKQEAAEAQAEQIKRFTAGTVADSAPIIPISAVLKYNIAVVSEYIVRSIP